MNAQPDAFARSPSASSAASGPAMVVAPRLFCAATSAPVPASASAAASAPRPITAMRPPPAVRACRRLRTAITRLAWSRVSAPAAHAAATSPTLCPMHASGCTPAARSAITSATCTANSSGCATEVSRIASAPTPAAAEASVAASRSTTDQPSGPRKAASAVSSAARNAGLRPIASAAMPAHWLPLPENTNATRPLTAVSVATAWVACPAR